MNPSPEERPRPDKPYEDGRQRLISVYNEVELLISHLQRLPETRIPRLFGTSARERSQREGTPIPPTNSLTYFLNRIAAVSAVLGTASGDETTELSIKADADAAQGPSLNDLAFLVWARDFLAAITYPASVETIRVTRAFRESRARPGLLLSWLKNRSEGAAEKPTVDGLSSEQVALNRYGAKLAHRVAAFHFLTVCFIAFSIWASFLVFAGRVLMRENDALRAAQTDLAARMLLADKDERGALVEAARSINPKIVPPADYCALSVPAKALKPLPEVHIKPSGADADPSDQQARPFFLLPQQERLCDEKNKLAQRVAELKMAHFLWVKSVSPLTLLLLRLPAFDFRTRQPADFQRLDLETHRFAMEQMVDGLIGSILPVAYACLGALAALFRRVGRKIENETLGPADYGTLLTSLVLGVLTGTVVGLFSDVMSLGDHPAVPLGTTALALLAGFASDRVFVMLDGVADRVFGHAEPETAKPDTSVRARLGERS